jgi:CRP/FNR family transcriptional regulator, anaerobic regulatory protein
MVPESDLDLARLKRACGECSLRQLCLPAGMDAGTIERLEELVGRSRPVGRGATLFRPGSPLTAVYVVRDGALKTTATSADGEEQVLGFHLPGEIVGLDALSAGVHRCEAVALSTARICTVPFAELTSIAGRVPALQQQLLRVIGRAQNQDRDHLELMFRRQAHERLAAFLQDLLERLPPQGAAFPVLSLPMSRDDVARYLGLAQETVSRAFGRLQEDGIVVVVGRRIEIRDPSELARLAHPDRLDDTPGSGLGRPA